MGVVRGNEILKGTAISDPLEGLAFHLLNGLFDGVVIGHETERADGPGGLTIPDLTFREHVEDGNRVLIEVTKSWLLPDKDPKEDQRRKLQSYVKETPGTAALVLYRQNFGTDDAQLDSLKLVDMLAMGEIDMMEAQARANQIALENSAMTPQSGDDHIWNDMVMALLGG